MTTFREGALKVLLLEDSKFDAELLRECLRATYPRATLELAGDERAFVAALTQGRFDLILSDFELPDIRGDRALQIARGIAPHVPLIFVSGVIGEDNAVELLKRGATDYVSKGRLSRLPLAIDRALREAAERAALERAQDQLREADATFARVVDCLRDYAVILLDRNGRVRSWNHAAREIVGYKRRRIIGASAALLFTPEDRASGALEAELRAALVAGKANSERWMVRADGSRLWAEGVVTPLFRQRGEASGFCKIVHDATLAHEQAAALRAAKEEAERANAAKDRFLAVLSHELRTPLTPIASAAHVLERYARVPEEYKNLLPMIQRNVALEARLIDDLLDLSAISAGKVTLKFKPVDMHHLVRVVLEMVVGQVRAKQLQVSLDLQAQHTIVEADEARIVQVLWNIVRNAVKFTPDGGRIAIRTQSEGGRFRLSCTDTGIGIDAAVVPRIFTAFEQADSEVSKRFGGLGLGLAIAKWLVAEHKGELTASSPGRGQGATFTLTLQSTQSTPDALAQRARRDDATVKLENSCHVLLVEDNEDSATPM